MDLYSSADFIGGKARIRVVIALPASQDQNVALRLCECKGKIAEELAARGLIGMKIPIYENKLRH